ncbi:MAG: phosphomannose isomerase type II C-terminal cupin domain [Smithellaceae bacterium]|nr:phosphomannose isomerase type II C-terminal cupin domain [Smithellaceae bacterium]
MEERPWGFFEILAETDNFKVKRILVRPGHRLSLQRHKQRREHWFVLTGEVLATLDGGEQLLRAGQSVDIPVMALHRMSNQGVAEATIIEIQTGTYFGEDDIERITDDYQREDCSSA